MSVSVTVIASGSVGGNVSVSSKMLEFPLVHPASPKQKTATNHNRIQVLCRSRHLGAIIFGLPVV
ncbi:MAG: hypothetical protein WDZ83_08850 [Rhizobiaceae bacterium]